MKKWNFMKLQGDLVQNSIGQVAFLEGEKSRHSSGSVSGSWCGFPQARSSSQINDRSIAISGSDWLEVPYTIYKAYFSDLWRGISTENMMNMAVTMGQYLHFSIQNFPLKENFPLNRALGRKMKGPSDYTLTSAHWDLESWKSRQWLNRASKHIFESNWGLKK